MGIIGRQSAAWGAFSGKSCSVGAEVRPSYVPGTYETSLDRVYPRELTERLKRA